MNKLRQGYVGRGTHGARTGRTDDGLTVSTSAAHMPWAQAWCTQLASTSASSSARNPSPTGLEQDAALFTAVWWRRCQTACCGCQPPFLDVGFDEDKATLPEIDVHGAGSVGADSRKEIRCFEAVRHIVELLAIASEEDRAGAWSVADSDNISLHVLGTVGDGVEWLVVAPMTAGLVGDRHLVHAWNC